MSIVTCFLLVMVFHASIKISEYRRDKADEKMRKENPDVNYPLEVDWD